MCDHCFTTGRGARRLSSRDGSELTDQKGTFFNQYDKKKYRWASLANNLIHEDSKTFFRISSDRRRNMQGALRLNKF